MVVNTSTAIAESGIKYIRRFIRSPYVDFQFQSVGLRTEVTFYPSLEDRHMRTSPIFL